MPLVTASGNKKRQMMIPSKCDTILGNGNPENADDDTFKV